MRAYLILILLAVWSIASCARIGVTPSWTEIQRFRQKHSNDAQSYRFLREANIDRYYDIVRVDAHSVVTTMRLLDRRFGSVPGFTNLTVRIAANELARIDKLKGEVVGLKRLTSQGGSLVEFEFEAEGKHEWGFMVLKNGDAIRRVVWSDDLNVVE